MIDEKQRASSRAAFRQLGHFCGTFFTRELRRSILMQEVCGFFRRFTAWARAEKSGPKD